MKYKKIRAEIKSRLKAANIPQREAAEHVGVATDLMNAWLNGKKDLTYPKIETLVRFLGGVLVQETYIDW